VSTQPRKEKRENEDHTAQRGTVWAAAALEKARGKTSSLKPSCGSMPNAHMPIPWAWTSLLRLCGGQTGNEEEKENVGKGVRL